MTNAIRDGNHVTVALGVSSTDSTNTLPLTIDSATGRLLTNSASGSGDVVGPSSSTNNAVARFDTTTGKLLQNSAVIIADTTGVITGTEGVTLSGTTSGTTALIATAAASGTITLPAATDTLVGKATTDTLTNKTINQDGTGNSITNLANASIKAAAAIDLDKLAALTASEIAISDASGFIVSAAVASYPSLTELAYVKGLSSAVQTQLDAKGIGDLKADGSVSLTSDWDAGSHKITAEQLESDITTGTAPLVVASTTVVANLQAATVATITGLAPDTATTQATQGSITTCSNLVTVGALDSGSITSNFGAIDNGASNITTTGTVQAGNIGLGTDGTASALTLTEKASIALDPAGGTDGDYSGITVTGTAGAALAFGDVVYLAVADSRWELADADAVATGGSTMVGICVLLASGDNEPTTILLHGIIRADTAFPALTVGSAVYLGVTAGDVQVAAPNGEDDVVKVLGYALTADEMYWNPSPDHITVKT